MPREEPPIGREDRDDWPDHCPGVVVLSGYSRHGQTDRLLVDSRSGVCGGPVLILTEAGRQRMGCVVPRASMWERNRLVSPEFGGASGPGVVVNRVGGGIGGGQRRVGAGPRRLDPARDAAILRAALEGLAELGYDRLSMDDIAARAHVGKAAIYRRWPSKAAVVVGAVAWWREQMGTVAVPI